MRALGSLITLIALALLGMWLIAKEEAPPASHPQYVPSEASEPRVEAVPKEGQASSVRADGARDDLEPAADTTPPVAPITGLRLAGIVSDGSGQPLAGAQVEVLAYLGSEVLYRGAALSAADGRYTVPLGILRRFVGSPGEEMVDIECYAIGEMHGRDGCLRSLLQKSGDVIRWDVTMEERQPSIRGRVVDSAGEPVGWADVDLDPKDHGGSSTETEWDGRFEFNNPNAPSDLAIRVNATGHGTATLTVKAADVSPFMDLGDVVLVEGAVIEGRVLDLNGNGIAGLWVEAFVDGEIQRFEHLTTTVKGGGFRFADLEVGVAYRVNGETVTSERDLYRAPQSGVELRVNVYSALVSLVDTAGNPVAYWRPRVRPLSPDGPEPSVSEAGGAMFTVAADDPISVRVSSHGDPRLYGRWLGGGRTIDLGAKPAEYTMTLQELDVSPVSCRFFEPGGLPIQKWRAYATDVVTGDPIGSVISSSPIQPLPLGEYRFEVRPLLPSFSLPFELRGRVRGEGTLELTATAERQGGHLLLTVAGGKRAQKYDIKVVPLTGSSGQPVHSRDGIRCRGKLALGEILEPGAYRVSVLAHVDGGASVLAPTVVAQCRVEIEAAKMTVTSIEIN